MIPPAVTFLISSAAMVAAMTAPAAASEGQDKNLRCLDIMGRETPQRPVGLSPSPIYIVGPPGKAEAPLESIRYRPQVAPEITEAQPFEWPGL